MDISELIGRLQWLRDTFEVENVQMNGKELFEVEYNKDKDIVELHDISQGQ